LVVVDWLEANAFPDEGFADEDEMALPLEVASRANRSHEVVSGILHIRQGSRIRPR